MPVTTLNYYEAVGIAARQTERIGEVYVVVTFRKKWRVLRMAHHITRSRIVWRPFPRKEAVVKKTEENRALIANMTIKEAAKYFNTTRGNVYTACKRYGWKYVARKHLRPPVDELAYTVGNYGLELAGVYFRVDPITVRRWCRELGVKVNG